MKTPFLKALALIAALTTLAVMKTAPVRATDSRAGLAVAPLSHTQPSAYRPTGSAPVVISSLPAQGLMAPQIEAAVEEYFASAASFDPQRFVNNFAPDGVLEDPVGTPPIQGTQAIAAFIANITAPFSEIKPTIQEVIVCGNEAAVNWKLKLTTKTGKHITIDGMGVFSFNAEGKLQSVREFWDLAAFLEQLQG
ncbi:MAG TPA: SgcJ/EcaC family oxidoreductase [Blastocatellia bacterium]|nr:SgcJ/EcaC family oxidoreductase [Blastocatellia bacterium]